MPDEATITETTEATEAEPQGEDWKAASRKWEKRAKDSNRENRQLKADLDALQKQLDGYETKAKDDAAKEQSATEQLDALKGELERLKAERERETLAREVAKAAGVSPEVLIRMQGDTKDEIEANANLLAETAKTRWPEVKDGGPQKAPGKTKEQILAIKDQSERVREIARNLDLFRKD